MNNANATVGNLSNINATIANILNTNSTIDNLNNNNATISNLINVNNTTENLNNTNTTSVNIITTNIYGTNSTFANAYINNLILSAEQLTLTGTNSTMNPSISTASTFITLNGLNIQTSGTLPNSGLYNGQTKTFICNTMGNLSTYTLHVNNLTVPNPDGLQRTKLQFTRQGQSYQLIWDSFTSRWVIFPGGHYSF